MDSAVAPPLTPMLGRLARELPGDGFVYEPKWDGFRCLAFVGGDGVDLRSRNDRPLGRYFPELVEALGSLAAEPFVLDGEILVVTPAGPDFPALMARLHPAASRVSRLSARTPATYVGFDLIALADQDLRDRPFTDRRRLLRELLADAPAPLRLTPATEDRRRADRWLQGACGRGVDGVMAKPVTLRYQPGARAMVKVKRQRTADCVVAGFRLFADRPVLSALLLGLHDESGELQHVGVASAFTEKRRRELLAHVVPHVTDLAGHPWERGFLLGGSPVGRLKGAAGRWSPQEMELDWVPLHAVLVCEVAYDHVDGDRFRHPARFHRWRPDRDPASCGFDQLELAGADAADLLPSG
jgi:ATP-dependent DNA ligase